MNSSPWHTTTSPTPKIHIITVLNRIDANFLRPFCFVLNTTILHNISVVVISFPIKGWKLREPFNVVMKIDFVYDYISQPFVKDNDIILFFDAKDAFFLSTAESIIEQFLKLNVTMLFSAEWNSWPPSQLHEWADVPPGYPRYLNAGGYIAYAKPLMVMFADMICEYTNKMPNLLGNDDQVLLHIFYKKHKYNIILDSNVTIFQSMYNQKIESFEFLDNHVVRNIITGGLIKIVHFNGVHPDPYGNVAPFLKHVFTGKESIMQQRYPNATFTAWFKGYTPVEVKIKELCEKTIITTTKNLLL